MMLVLQRIELGLSCYKYLSPKWPIRKQERGLAIMNDLMLNALDVHEVLTRYIKIHNDIFKSSIRRIIPIPGIFQAIDYRKHHHNLVELTNELETIISKTIGNDEFPRALREFTQALFETISTLREICEKLYNKSQGESNAYPKKQYDSDLKEYYSCERKHQILGERLNQFLR